MGVVQHIWEAAGRNKERNFGRELVGEEEKKGKIDIDRLTMSQLVELICQFLRVFQNNSLIN